MKADQNIVIVGGGHAGIEAAFSADRLGVSVILVTMDPSSIGRMSCNPAIGGLGKGHLVQEIDDLLHLKAAMRKIALLLEIDPDTPETIWTDPRRLKQILFNLSGNALKFTFKGHVKLCLSPV